MSRSRSRSPQRARYGEGGKPPHSDDLFSVQLEGLPDSTRQEDIRRDFEKFGKIGDLFLPIDRNTGRTRGFGFVRFYEKRDQEDCVDEFKRHPYEIEGKEVGVQFAKPRPRPGRRGWDPDRRRGYGGGGGGGRDYGRDRSPGGYGGRRSRTPPRRRERSRSYERRRSPPRRDDRDDRRGGDRYSRRSRSRDRY